MGKLVAPLFRQMVRRIQDWYISSRNHIYHLYKSVPFTKKRPQIAWTSIKDGFEEMEQEFPFGIFRPEEQDCTFSDVPLLLEIFLWNDPKSCVLFTFHVWLDFREYKFGKW